MTTHHLLLWKYQGCIIQIWAGLAYCKAEPEPTYVESCGPAPRSYLLYFRKTSYFAQFYRRLKIANFNSTQLSIHCVSTFTTILSRDLNNGCSEGVT